jgi:hypothetical protein
MAGSTIGVPMSPGYGGYQAATPPPSYTTTTYATTGYHTTKAAEYYTTTYDTLHRSPEVKLCPEMPQQRG